MGRAEKRLSERKERIESRRNKILISKEELSNMRDRDIKIALNYNVEALFTCFGLAQHELYGFGEKRIARTLEYIDSLMGQVNDDKITIEDLKSELLDKTGILIKCDR